MTLGEQTRWWLLVLGAVILFFWLFGGALTPFLAGMAIAYLLDPLADRLERARFSRLAATATISLISLSLFVAALLLLIPALAEQIGEAAGAAPQALSDLRTFLEARAGFLPPELLRGDGAFAEVIAQVKSNLEEWGVSLLQRVASGGLAAIEFISLVVITPVVAFYLLLDWDRMIAEIDHWLPRRHAPAIRRLAGDIDQVLAGFLRGQLTVCLILGTFYAIALVALGLNFGLLIGLFAGLISFIPFVGALFGGALSIGVALFQFWGDWPMIAGVAAVFLAGQAVEGNFLTPKLVGDSVGLHPVWLMLALSVFGAAMGFTGLLIAVPAAAALGVLTRFGLEQYREGRLYLGGEPILPDDPDWDTEDRAARRKRGSKARS